MWQDMGLYWAWRGKNPNGRLPPKPTEKRIEYAEIVGPGRYLDGDKKGDPIRMRLAVTVFDDQVQREVNRDELSWHRKHGAEIVMPLNGEMMQ
jgi:hypothetical protein